jgi:hypothetical protein
MRSHCAGLGSGSRLNRPQNSIRFFGALWYGIAPIHHIRAAVGRDYRDVPPPRGVFKGVAASELAVSVRVRKADGPTPRRMPARMGSCSSWAHRLLSVHSWPAFNSNNSSPYTICTINLHTNRLDWLTTSLFFFAIDAPQKKLTRRHCAGWRRVEDGGKGGTKGENRIEEVRKVCSPVNFAVTQRRF